MHIYVVEEIGDGPSVADFRDMVRETEERTVTNSS